jgi:hypothetical protein
MKRTVTIEIDRCSDCKHHSEIYFIRCNFNKRRGNYKAIPKWCPLLKKGKI